MASHYEDRAAVCPFYKGIDEYNKYSLITCEGMIPGSVSKQQFYSRKKRDTHKACFCDTFEYGQCPVYEAVNEKYK